MYWLKRPHAVVLTGILVVQIFMVYGFSRPEKEPPHLPLAEFPTSIGGWMLEQMGSTEAEIREALQADDLLSRTYRAPDSAAAVSLFVAYFKSQRVGVWPHSPKHCLPGAGWVADVTEVLSVPVPGRDQPLRVNLYQVSKGEARSVVLYWYQSRGRMIASEFEAKIYLVADSIRYNRTDTALVRVVAPVADRRSDLATETAVKFVQAIFKTLGPFASG